MLTQCFLAGIFTATSKPRAATVLALTVQKLSLDGSSLWSGVATMGFHCRGTGWNFFELLRLGIIFIASIYLVAAGHFGWTIFLNVLLAVHQKSPDSSKDFSFRLSTSQKVAAVVAQWLSCSGISNMDFIGCKWDLSAVQIFCLSSSVVTFTFRKLEGYSRRHSPLVHPSFLCIKHSHPSCLGTLSF